MKKQLAAILINEYYNLFSITLENSISKYEAMQCAEVAVKEVIKALRINQEQNQKIIEFYEKVLIHIENYEERNK